MLIGKPIGCIKINLFAVSRALRQLIDFNWNETKTIYIQQIFMNITTITLHWAIWKIPYKNTERILCWWCFAVFSLRLQKYRTMELMKTKKKITESLDSISLRPQLLGCSIRNIFTNDFFVVFPHIFPLCDFVCVCFSAFFILISFTWRTRSELYAIKYPMEI